MFFKPFGLRGHRQCPHKPPSCCNTHVIIQMCVLINHVYQFTHTHTHTALTDAPAPYQTLLITRHPSLPNLLFLIFIFHHINLSTNQISFRICSVTNSDLWEALFALKCHHLVRCFGKRHMQWSVVLIAHLRQQSEET